MRKTSPPLRFGFCQSACLLRTNGPPAPVDGRFAPILTDSASHSVKKCMQTARGRRPPGRHALARRGARSIVVLGRLLGRPRLVALAIGFLFCFARVLGPSWVRLGSGSRPLFSESPANLQGYLQHCDGEYGGRTASSSVGLLEVSSPIFL